MSEPKCLCGNQLEKASWYKMGYRKTCTVCRKNKYGIKKNTFCEYCGFVALRSCQLDVDHIDGDHNNNDANNLQTLCANCHRLKTHTNFFSTEEDDDSG